MRSVATLYKNAFGGLAPSTWWLSLVMLINRSGTMVVPFMSLYLTESRHCSIGMAGIVMALFGLGAVCGGFLGGRLTDKLGFYPVQISALVSGGLLYILLGQLTDIRSICVCTFVLATLNESFRPANATAIAQYSKKENLTRSFSLNRLSINLGWMAGGALGGIIAAHNYSLLFWIDGLTNIGAAILLRAVLSPKKNAHTPPRKEIPTGNNLRQVMSDRHYMVFIVLTILFGFSFFQVFTTLPLYYKQHLGLTPSFIGMTMALNGLLISVLEMAIVFKMEQRNAGTRIIILGALLVGASYAVLNVLPGQWSLALLVTLIITAGEMLSMPFMNAFWVRRTNEHNRGQYAGMYTVAWSIAQISAPFAGTQIISAAGYNVLWWFVGGITVVVAYGFFWLSRHA
jgi:predicted MFS family arabinose efflux permease